MISKPTFLDLFCGCGGFSLGLERAGFNGLAAIDFNKEAIQVFQANFRNIPHILERDLTQYSPSDLERLIGTDHVDLIVGGPPCQGFSTARQVDGANHGERLKDDPRRHLYKEFLRHIEHFKPKVFVMENVLGIRSASGGIYFSKVQAEARRLGYKVHAQLEECVKLGVPQKRRRQLFIGTRQDLPAYFRPTLKRSERAGTGATLWDAIGDLPPLAAGEGEEESKYDRARLSKAYMKDASRNYLLNVLEIEKVEILSAHRSRPHSDRDLGDFKLLKEGESSAEAMRRKVEFAFPYDKTSFKDRYTRQHRNRPCSTIVAHLAKDGLMFIHPTQNRSLTPREAARIQSFPDWFSFPVARTHQFRVIGNAVPPLVSEAVGDAVVEYLKKLSNPHGKQSENLVLLPTTDNEAAEYIIAVAELERKEISSVSQVDFKRAWYSISFLYSGLHPDGALDHGDTIIEGTASSSLAESLDHRLITPIYECSGWPVFLERIAAEAWSRYSRGEMAEGEFYCNDAQIAGIRYRNPGILISA